MKIAQVVCVLPPKAGGIGRAAHCYSEELTKLGHEVVVFTPKTDVDLAVCKNYKVEMLKPAMGNGLAAVLPSLFWKLKKIDAVILHYPFFGTALLTAVAARLRHKKLVVVYHMDVVLAGWKKWYEKIGRLLFLKFILNSADKIVCSSVDYVENSNIKKYFEKHRGKFVEIPFGAADSFSPAGKEQGLLARHGLVDSDKVVLFVGGLNSAHYFKGIDYLIDAIGLIADKNIKALIVGSGNLKSEYEQLVADKNLEGRVKFAGFVSDEFLPKYFNLSDAVILPSINSSEAFGIVLVEGMACGKPVLASDLAGVRAVVENGKNGFVFAPKNSLAIAEKIVALFSDEARYELLRKNCLAVVEEKYRWRVVAKKLNDVILS